AVRVRVRERLGAITADKSCRKSVAGIREQIEQAQIVVGLSLRERLYARAQRDLPVVLTRPAAQSIVVKVVGEADVAKVIKVVVPDRLHKLAGALPTRAPGVS